MGNHWGEDRRNRDDWEDRREDQRERRQERRERWEERQEERRDDCSYIGEEVREQVRSALQSQTHLTPQGIESVASTAVDIALSQCQYSPSEEPILNTAEICADQSAVHANSAGEATRSQYSAQEAALRAYEGCAAPFAPGFRGGGRDRY